jgi:hypothetical protein
MGKKCGKKRENLLDMGENVLTLEEHSQALM